MTRHAPAIATLALMSLVWSGGGCSQRRDAAAVADAATDDKPLEGREAVLTIFGMSCPLCANNVDKTLAAVPGVSMVHVDMGAGRARIAIDGSKPVTRRQLAAAVDRSGFTLKGIETP
ncbi:MAG: heavy-metal-associated domain-containing protein [Phycisphaerae bacterium]